MPVDEEVALVDEAGTPVGVAPRSRMRAENLLHAATAVLLRDGRGRIYVHRRTDTKDWAPGHWDAAAGGVLRSGEDPQAGAARELAEELGVRDVELRPLGTNLFEDESSRCFEHVYEATWDGTPRLQAEEVAEGRWLPLEGLGPLQAEERFVPDTAQLLAGLAGRAASDYGQLRAFAALRASGVRFAVTRHGPVGSLAEAAAARGLQPRQIVKTLVVRVADGDVRLVLVPGDRGFSWPRLRAVLGVSRLSMPDAAGARAATGYERGTITPFGATTGWPVLADAALCAPDAPAQVSLGAGAHGVAVTVDVAQALAALQAQVAEVSED